MPHLKLLLKATLLSAAILLALPGCGEKSDPKVSVTGVSVSPTTLSLKEGESSTLSASVSPSNATTTDISWSSSNSSVATVSSGKVSAIKAGSATITVTTVDGGKTATCSVTVTSATVNVTGVTLSKTSLEMTEGDSETLSATVSPSDASDKTVSWSSSNESVAKVDGGKVTAVKAGEATVTVTTKDGSKTASCKVTVNAKVISVTGVSLSKTSLTLKKGSSETLSATINPSDATNKNISWTSSNTAVATVDAGAVKAVSVGSATITVKTEDGSFTATCSVTVSPADDDTTGEIPGADWGETK